MSQYPHFAPGSLPDILNTILLWTLRISGAIFIISLAGVTFIGRTQLAVWIFIISGFVCLVAAILHWALNRFWPD